MAHACTSKAAEVETRWWGSGHSDWPSGLTYSVSAKPASSKVDNSWGMVPCVYTHLPVGVHPCEHTETQLTVSGLFPEEESLCQLLAPSSSSCFSTLCSLASVLCLTLFFSEGTFGANLALDLSFSLSSYMQDSQSFHCTTVVFLGILTLAISDDQQWHGEFPFSETP